LLTSTLEYTNEPYAIAKIAGIKMCEGYNLQYGTNFISVMPTNLYGPNDNFNLETSHVLPALLRKIHLGKSLEENNWTTIKEDLNKRPIEGITGEASKQEILKVLQQYGLSLQPVPVLAGDDESNPRNPQESAQSAFSSAQSVSVEIWGSGKPMREFLWSEDMADACVFLMETHDANNPSKSVIDTNPRNPSKSAQSVPSMESAPIRESSGEAIATHINIGTGKEISIAQLANTIKESIGFQGDLVFNTSKPDGTMRKLTDVSKLNALGWKHSIELKEGVERMYDWYIE